MQLEIVLLVLLAWLDNGTHQFLDLWHEPNEDGSENKTLVEVIAIVEEIFRALQEDANIQIAFKPGDFSILSQGSGEGVVISNGTNINFPTGTGVII